MSKTPVIAVAGNPNSGKTTLFNGLTGSKQRIGNWPGVTVEKKEGALTIAGQNITLVDLPGVYSLSAHSEDEKVARDYVLSGEADLILNIVDATNIERNLYLTTQLLEMKVPLVLVVNMLDLAEKSKIKIDLKYLEQKLGCPVVGISAVNTKDYEQVKKAVSSALQNRQASDLEIHYPQEIEKVLADWTPVLNNAAVHLHVPARWIAIKLLEQDVYITSHVVAQKYLTNADITPVLDSLEKQLSDSTDVILADYRFKMIHSVLQDTVEKPRERVSASDRIDRVVMHRILGIPVFLGVMYLVFWVTMTIGGAFIDFFDILFGTIFVDGLGQLLHLLSLPEWFIAFAAGGVGAGIQTVSTFVPIIFFMFFMLSLLEDSGYMARAAFVMDKFLRWIGLPGKSFVPMLVGFGCTVPAIMATRTLENKKDRYMTVFMTPFMSCGARLPVYALFGVAFFGSSKGTMVFSIYLIGVVLAILTGLLLKKTLFAGEPSHFIMELPPYHAPRMKNILTYTWHRLKSFILRAGKVIVVVVIILSFLNTIGTDGSFGNEDSENSLLSGIGKTITPVFSPMGIEEDNWPAAVAVFTGIFAKEVIVGTLNSLYSHIEAIDAEPQEEEFSFIDGITEAFASVPEALRGVLDGLLDPLGLSLFDAGEDELADELDADSALFGTMQKYFPQGPLQAYAYLLFILIYFPCVAAFGAAVREIGKGYGTLLVSYLTVLAWIIATLFYQIALGRQIVWIVLPLVMLFAIVALFAMLGKKASRQLQDSLNIS